MSGTYSETEDWLKFQREFKGIKSKFALSNESVKYFETILPNNHDFSSVKVTLSLVLKNPDYDKIANHEIGCNKISA